MFSMAIERSRLEKQSTLSNIQDCRTAQMRHLHFIRKQEFFPTNMAGDTKLRCIMHLSLATYSINDMVSCKQMTQVLFMHVSFLKTSQI